MLLDAVVFLTANTKMIFLNGPNPASFLFIFVLFSHCKDNYSTNLTINDKSVDGVLGSRGTLKVAFLNSKLCTA